MINALRLHDLRSSRDRTGGLDRAHDGFGARVAEPDLLEAFGPAADGFRQSDLLLRRKREGRAVCDLASDGLNDVRLGVAVDQRGEVVQKIEAPRPVDIDDVGPSPRAA